jgi:hypothetical protein
MMKKYKIWTPGLILGITGKNERVSERYSLLIFYYILTERKRRVSHSKYFNIARIRLIKY